MPCPTLAWACRVNDALLCLRHTDDFPKTVPQVVSSIRKIIAATRHFRLDAPLREENRPIRHAEHDLRFPVAGDRANLLMNDPAFEGPNATQQAALLMASANAKAYCLAEVKKQDAASVKVFLRAGVEIANMSPEDFAAWRAIAQETSYKKFVSDVPDGQALLDMTLAVDEALEK